MLRTKCPQPLLTFAHFTTLLGTVFYMYGPRLSGDMPYGCVGCIFFLHEFLVLMLDYRWQTVE